MPTPIPFLAGDEGEAGDPGEVSDTRDAAEGHSKEETPLIPLTPFAAAEPPPYAPPADATCEDIVGDVLASDAVAAVVVAVEVDVGVG